MLIDDGDVDDAEHDRLMGVSSASDRADVHRVTVAPVDRADAPAVTSSERGP